MWTISAVLVVHNKLPSSNILVYYSTTFEIINFYRKNYMSSLPKIAVLHLKRFTMDDFYQPKKVSDPISVPSENLKFEAFRISDDISTRIPVSSGTHISAF